jgi:hypothetical protein
MIRCLSLRVIKMNVNEMIFGKLKLHIYILHEVVNQSYKGMLKNQLDSSEINLKPWRRLKHRVND